MGCGKYLIAIGIGSNVDPHLHIPRAVHQLHEYFDAVQVSTLYRTRPLGGAPGLAPFVNGVVSAMTTAPVQAVKGVLAELEKRAGRVRNKADKSAPRTLDLDLLLYEYVVSAEWRLPAAELVERDFVLLPAAELLPGWCHPVLKRELTDLAKELFPEPVSIIEVVDFVLAE